MRIGLRIDGVMASAHLNGRETTNGIFRMSDDFKLRFEKRFQFVSSVVGVRPIERVAS